MSENIAPSHEELYQNFVKVATARVRAGLCIISSDDVPAGYRRMIGSDVFVSQSNYDLFKEMSAKQVLICLGLLKDMASETPTNVAEEQR